MTMSVIQLIQLSVTETCKLVSVLPNANPAKNLWIIRATQTGKKSLDPSRGTSDMPVINECTSNATRREIAEMVLPVKCS